MTSQDVNDVFAFGARLRLRVRTSFPRTLPLVAKEANICSPDKKTRLHRIHSNTNHHPHFFLIKTLRVDIQKML